MKLSVTVFVTETDLTTKGNEMEKYLKKLIDRLEVENLRLQNTNDRLCRECNRLKRENAKLRNAVAELVGDKLTACKLLGEGTTESEGSAVDN